jgi:hypothetical protein
LKRMGFRVNCAQTASVYHPGLSFDTWVEAVAYRCKSNP